MAYQQTQNYQELIGALPTSVMMILGLVFLKLHNSYALVMSAAAESAIQSFSAGMVLAGVAVELIPMIHSLAYDPGYKANLVAVDLFIALGFFIGISVIYGLDYLIDYINQKQEDRPLEVNRNYYPTQLYQASTYVQEPSLLGTDNGSVYGSIHSEITGGEEEVKYDWEAKSLLHSELALSNSNYKIKLIEELIKVNKSIESIDNNIAESLSMVRVQTCDPKTGLCVLLDENIDREIHELQYTIDHCRRLIEGTGFGFGRCTALDSTQKLEFMKKKLHLLRKLSSTILEDAEKDSLSVETIRKIHGHVDQIGEIVSDFHTRVEKAAALWRKVKFHIRDLPVPPTGSSIPMSLMMPVVIDCVMDGLLIGLSLALNVKVGIVLCLVNSIEMGFLGTAVAIRVQKCTGSSIVARYLSVSIPPIIMYLSFLVGLVAGNLSKLHSHIFIVLASIGVVALLHLACNEMLWEARRAMYGVHHKIGGILFFSAFYLVIVLDRFMPENVADKNFV